MAWAADATVLGGSKDDEHRVPRTQSHTGPQSSFNWARQTVLSSFISGHLSCGPRQRWSEQWHPGFHFRPEGGRVRLLTPWEQEAKENLERHSGAAGWL